MTGVIIRTDQDASWFVSSEPCSAIGSYQPHYRVRSIGALTRSQPPSSLVSPFASSLSNPPLAFPLILPSSSSFLNFPSTLGHVTKNREGEPKRAVVRASSEREDFSRNSASEKIASKVEVAEIL